jgi:hypothetical protein
MIGDAIDHLTKYLALHTRSASPFVLLASYNHIKTLILLPIIKAENTSIQSIEVH